MNIANSLTGHHDYEEKFIPNLKWRSILFCCLKYFGTRCWQHINTQSYKQKGHSSFRHYLAPEVNIPTFQEGELVKFWLIAMFIYEIVCWQSALSSVHIIMSEQGLLGKPSSSDSPAKSTHCSARKQNWNRNPKWLCSMLKIKITRKNT